jgi:hypothetical protein
MPSCYVLQSESFCGLATLCEETLVLICPRHTCRLCPEYGPGIASPLQGTNPLFGQLFVGQWEVPISTMNIVLC